MRQHHDSNVDMAIIALMRDSLLLPHEVAGARWEDLTPAEDRSRKLPIASSKDNPRAIVHTQRRDNGHLVQNENDECQRFHLRFSINGTENTTSVRPLCTSFRCAIISRGGNEGDCREVPAVPGQTRLAVRIQSVRCLCTAARISSA